MRRAAEIAAAAEKLGYVSVWTNDTSGGDGIAHAAAMLEATTAIQVGIGALPCDRWPVAEVASRLERLASVDRLAVVVGAGRAGRPLAAVEKAVAALRKGFGLRMEVGVAALGPNMCRLAGRIADLVLLNWSTPERIAWSRSRVEEGAAQSRRTDAEAGQLPKLAAYVRLALGPRAESILRQEASAYARAPHYARHFGSMGRAPGLAAFGRDADQLLRPFDEALDETVVRAVPSSPETEELLEIARAGAPPPAGP